MMAPHAQAPATRPALRRSAWSALASHNKGASKLHLRRLFADHPKLGQRKAIEAVVMLNHDSSTNYLIRRHSKRKESHEHHRL